MEGNYSVQSWKMLWCECGGNRSGSLLEDKLSHLHEGVWIQGVIYVSVVIFLYVVGFSVILLQSERSFHSSSSTGGFLGLPFGCPQYYGKRKKHRHRDRREVKERRERKHSKEIELRKLRRESKLHAIEIEGPSKVDVSVGAVIDHQAVKNKDNDPKPPNPLIKVTVETTPENSPTSRNSSSNLLTFI